MTEMGSLLYNLMKLTEKYRINFRTSEPESFSYREIKYKYYTSVIVRIFDHEISSQDALLTWHPVQFTLFGHPFKYHRSVYLVCISDKEVYFGFS